MSVQRRAQPASGERAEAERSDRGQRSGNGEACCAGEREPQKDDVARHVGHEHVPEHEVAERVDEARHNREAQQEGRKRTVGILDWRHDRPPDILEWPSHGHDAIPWDIISFGWPAFNRWLPLEGALFIVS